MLPAGARAVILLVNSLQILLPGPAFVEQGRCWVPARQPLQRLGYTVKWVPAQHQVLIASPGQNALVTLTELPNTTGAAPANGVRRLGNLLYVPLVALRPLAVKARFDSAERTVTMDRLTTVPREASLGAILADPPGWLGRLVRLHGEYFGWSPYPYCYATASPRDGAVGDFVLRNEGGAIYCHVVPPPLAARSSLGVSDTERPPLTPYESVGRRIVVVGTVRLAEAGTPRLDAQSVVREPGLAGLTCCLRVDQGEYQPGDRVACAVYVANPGKEALSVPLGQRGADLSVASPDGILSITKLTSAGLTFRNEALQLAAGASLTIPVTWSVPDTAVPGVYQVAAHLAEGLDSYPASFRVSLRSLARERLP